MTSTVAEKVVPVDTMTGENRISVHVNKILNHCPNYDNIVNYEFVEGDNLSSNLIDWYRELVFSVDPEDDKQLRIIEVIDKSLCLYVKDNKYKRGLKSILNEREITLDDQGLIKELIKKIISFTNTYEKKIVLEIENTKWL